jgi:hypothetical protein
VVPAVIAYGSWTETGSGELPVYSPPPFQATTVPLTAIPTSVLSNVPLSTSANADNTAVEFTAGVTESTSLLGSMGTHVVPLFPSSRYNSLLTAFQLVRWALSA